MFLRTQSGSRFATAVLRLCGYSAPSAASSASNSSRASTVLSRCNNHVIAPSTPQLARYSGTSAVSAQVGVAQQSVKTAEKAKTEYFDGIFDFNTHARVDDLKFKGICAFVISGCTLFMLSLVVDDQLDRSMIPADAEQVDFDTFIKYFRAGAIEKVLDFDGRNKAVGTLREGAMVDIEPGNLMARSGHIVFDYPYPKSHIFRAEVREEEAKMGISPSQKVDIQKYINPAGVMWKNPLAPHFILFGMAMVAAQLTTKKSKSHFAPSLAMILIGYSLAAIQYNKAKKSSGFESVKRKEKREEESAEPERKIYRMEQSCYMG